MKRRILCILLLLCLMLSACAGEAPAEAEAPGSPELSAEVEIPEENPETPAAGEKIGIISPYQNLNLRVLAETAKPEDYVCSYWSDEYPFETEKIVECIEASLNDPEVGLLLMNSVHGDIAAALEETAELRPEVPRFVCLSDSMVEGLPRQADLLLDFDYPAQAKRMVEQAVEMGAENLVYYEYWEWKNRPEVAEELERMEEICRELGISYQAALGPEAMGHESHIFVPKDLARRVTELGEKTAFCSSAGNLQHVLIAAVLEHGGIYPGPVWPEQLVDPAEDILGSSREEDDLKTGYSISHLDARQQLREKGPDGRIADFPISYSELELRAAYEYARLWLAGELPEQGVDKGALLRIMEEISGVDCHLEFEDYFGDDLNKHVLYYIEPQLVEWE
ncbi:MAG: DUF3798 domain-containing protein [Bacillota bacterium]|nr:DUF3798 domain-containing protein [Bacillota bacterium]